MKTLKKYDIFMFIFLLYFIPKYLEYTTFVRIDGVLECINILKTISYVLAVLYWSCSLLKTRKIPVFYLFTVLLLLLYFAYQAFVKDRNSIFIVLLFSLIFEEKNIDRFVKNIYQISCLMYLATISASILGFIPNIISEGNKFDLFYVKQSSLGFEYCGQTIMMLIPIVFMFYYIKKDSIRWYHNVTWIGIDLIVFLVCRTVMGFALILLFIALFNYVKHMRIRKKRVFTERRWIIYSPLIFFTITMIFLYFDRISVSFRAIIDFICNGRFNLGNIMIDAYGIKLLGTSFVNNTEYYYEILDSEYMHMLVGEGILYLVIALLLGCIIMRYMVVRRDDYMTLIFFLVFFNAIVNNGIYNPVMNPFCLVLSVSIRQLYNLKPQTVKEKCYG